MILFDLDGTLTDPYVGISRSVAHALSVLGLPALPEARLRAFIGPPLQDGFAGLGLGADDVDRAVALYRERYSDLGITELSVYDGVPAALSALAASGARLGVATSKPLPFATRVLASTGLDGFFEVVSGATLDGTIRAKADIVAAALGSLGGSTGVLVGDRVHDVVGARAHGLGAVGVTWGFAEPGELAAAVPDVVVDSPGELPAALGPWLP